VGSPWICREGSQGLIYAGINESLKNKQTAQSLQVRRISMNVFRSLSHTAWDYKYHLVLIFRNYVESQILWFAQNQKIAD
jgi:hypothetical protein